MLHLQETTKQIIMTTFVIALCALVLGYLIYGSFVERVFGADPKRKTPCYTHQDGVDYIPMPTWKVYLIQFLNIAGTGTIKKYTLNKATRYYLSNDNMDSESIVLTCGRKTDTSCHEENTYVFVIPGGLLGCGAATTGEIYVNDDAEAFATRSFLKGSAAAQKENAFIYFNTKKDDKLVVPTYNPKDAVIIKDQLELLTYIREYNAGTKKDAYLCSDAVLDFSRDAMIKISTEMGGQNADISNYLANGFPSIKTLENSISGNGAVISDVEIKDEKGMFGVIDGGSVSGITLKNVVAEDLLLTSNAENNATVEDVTIDNCTAKAIFGWARPAAIAGITVVDEKAEKSVANVAEELRLNADMAIKDLKSLELTPEEIMEIIYRCYNLDKQNRTWYIRNRLVIQSTVFTAYEKEYLKCIKSFSCGENREIKEVSEGQPYSFKVWGRFYQYIDQE